MKKIVLLAFVLVLLSTAVVIGFIRPVKASGTIYIRADGSVEGTTYISTVDDVIYTFTNNIYEPIVIERGNIVVDGAGYILQGTGSGESTGIKLESKDNVTIKNMEIEAFGYAAIWLDSSSNNIIHGNTINNAGGIALEHSSNNIISGNTINNAGGIYLGWYSSNNTVSGNTITNNAGGISISWYSSNNTIHGNTITNNDSNGISISWYSPNNTISGNNLINNERGILLLNFSSNNEFYHNNFIDNTQQVYILTSGYANFWDDGYPSGGNYWDDYGELDADGDGIGDTPYVIDANNTDSYPLVVPLGPIPIVYDGMIYPVELRSNSTVFDIHFSQILKQVSFNVTGPTETTGFCNVTIPDDLIWGEFSIYMDDSPLVKDEDYTQTHIGTHYIFYITYIHTTHMIEIRGTEVIPEFPTWTSLLLILILLTAALVIYKRRLLKTPIH